MSYALITGASKGIGKAIAYQLAAKKINLFLVARSEDLLHQIASDLIQQYAIDVHFLRVDLSDDKAGQMIFDWIINSNIQINILINNAGYGLSGRFEKYTAQEHTEMMHVNMISMVALSSLFLPLLQKQKQSYIMNIASTAAYQAVPFLSTYAASKSFVVSFTRALQFELKKTNVAVTCFSPGGTDTGFGARANVGKKAMKAGEKLNMTADEAASIAIKSMFKKKREVIAGFINILGAFMVWLAPKAVAERFAANLYED